MFFFLRHKAKIQDVLWEKRTPGRPGPRVLSQHSWEWRGKSCQDSSCLPCSVLAPQPPAFPSHLPPVDLLSTKTACSPFSCTGSCHFFVVGRSRQLPRAIVLVLANLGSPELCQSGECFSNTMRLSGSEGVTAPPISPITMDQVQARETFLPIHLRH